MNIRTSGGLPLPKSENPEYIIDFAGILQLLPHRDPFLFVDGVTALEPGSSISGVKLFSFGDSFFRGHFPGEPVVPGVVQIEALAQVSCILAAVSFPEAAGKRPAFAGIDQAKFKMPVRPGDRMLLHAHLENYRRGICILRTRAEVRGGTAAEAVIKSAMV